MFRYLVASDHSQHCDQRSLGAYYCPEIKMVEVKGFCMELPELVESSELSFQYIGTWSDSLEARLALFGLSFDPGSDVCGV